MTLPLGSSAWLGEFSGIVWEKAKFREMFENIVEISRK
jgi:hypothetical protein